MGCGVPKPLGSEWHFFFETYGNHGKAWKNMGRDSRDRKYGWWFGTWLLWLSIYCGFHQPNWQIHIFQRGWVKPPTRWCSKIWTTKILDCVCPDLGSQISPSLCCSPKKKNMAMEDLPFADESSTPWWRVDYCKLIVCKRWRNMTRIKFTSKNIKRLVCCNFADCGAWASVLIPSLFKHPLA